MIKVLAICLVLVMVLALIGMSLYARDEHNNHMWWENAYWRYVGLVAERDFYRGNCSCDVRFTNETGTVGILWKEYPFKYTDAQGQERHSSSLTIGNCIYELAWDLEGNNTVEIHQP